MAEAVTSAFLTVVAVFVACLILAWPIYRVVSLWLDQAIGTGEASLALFALLSFLGGIMRTWGQPLNVLLWLLLLATAAVISVGHRARRRIKLDEFFRADVAAAQRALAKDPDNAAAHMRLGTLYEQREDFDAAIEHYEQVTRTVPRDSEARLLLANVIEKRRRATTGHLICWRCGRENATDAAHCQACGVLISDRNRVLRWLALPKTSRAIAALAIASLISAVAGSLLESVPVPLTILCYALLFLAVLCYVYPRWSQPEG